MSPDISVVSVLVAGDDDAGPLVAAGDDPVERIGEHAIQRREAQLVEYDQMELDERGDARFDGLVGERASLILARRAAARS